MVWEKRLGGLAVAGAVLLHLMPEAWAGERMQLGVPLAAAEFQTQVGDRVFFSEGSAELGARARIALGGAGNLAQTPYGSGCHHRGSRG